MAMKATALLEMADALIRKADIAPAPRPKHEKTIRRQMAQKKSEPKPGEKRGAKPGTRNGGRVAGTPNKSTLDYLAKLAEAEKIAYDNIDHVAIDRMDPLDFLLAAMRFCAHQGLLFKAAEFAMAAVPYTNPKLTTIVTHTIPYRGGGDVHNLTDQQIFDQIMEIRKRNGGATVEGEAEPDEVPPSQSFKLQ